MAANDIVDDVVGGAQDVGKFVIDFFKALGGGMTENPLTPEQAALFDTQNDYARLIYGDTERRQSLVGPRFVRTSKFRRFRNGHI